MTSQELLSYNEHLHLLTIRCPHCKRMWLAPGVEHGDTYVCKECGLGFVVNRQVEQPSQPFAKLDHPEKSDS